MSLRITIHPLVVIFQSGAVWWIWLTDRHYHAAGVAEEETTFCLILQVTLINKAIRCPEVKRKKLVNECCTDILSMRWFEESQRKKVRPQKEHVKVV